MWEENKRVLGALCDPENNAVIPLRLYVPGGVLCHPMPGAQTVVLQKTSNMMCVLHKDHLVAN